MAGLIIGGWGARLKADPPMMTRFKKSVDLFFLIILLLKEYKATLLGERSLIVNFES